jgi:hypothetical protein
MKQLAWCCADAEWGVVWGDKSEEATVQGQEHILRDRFAQDVCAVCGAYHRPDDMHVLARRGSRWLILLTCWQCQRRGIFVASFPPVGQASQSIEPPNGVDAPTVYPQPSPSHWQTPSSPFPLINDAPSILGSHASSSTPDLAISASDVDSIRRFLEGFNGDFRTLFGPSNGMAHG